MVRRLVRGSSMGSGWGFLGSFSALGLLLGGFFLLLLLLLGLGLFVGGGEDVQVLELIAGGDKGVGGLALPHADHRHARLPQAGGQAGEVAVGGHQAEALYFAGVEDVHGVDDHGGVGGVFPRGVAVLLDGADGIVQQHAFPGDQGGVGPVAVNALVGGHPVFGDLVQDQFDVFPRHVIRVDEHREPAVAGHRITASSPAGRGFFF